LAAGACFRNVIDWHQQENLWGEM
jgi:hypothetical protein